MPIRLSDDFSAETLQVRREWDDIFKVMKEKNLQPRIPGTVFIQILRRNKKFYRDAKLKEFITMNHFYTNHHEPP